MTLWKLDIEITDQAIGFYWDRVLKWFRAI